MNETGVPDTTQTVRVSPSRLRKAVSREVPGINSFLLESVELDGEEVAVEIREPVGECPACETIEVGSINDPVSGKYPYQFDCSADECDVDIHENRIDTEAEA